ncbi:32965_t:CDS:2 [Gigaspora margarita]|uniref:32965_t:CDS:1 n=1 Tax=Gigaspora margarita TaxID=4874 RepID=A0ABN7UI31_GIGMA|nr:32965_t:CDS:2 [Gigaspora margarita]
MTPTNSNTTPENNSTSINEICKKEIIAVNLDPIEDEFSKAKDPECLE